MKNLLFVSIAFPPKNDPECIQTAKYFRYLSKSENLNIDVVTSKDPTLFMPEDSSLKEYDTGYRQKIQVPIYENKYSNFLLRKILPEGIDYPDSKFSFYWQWRKVVKQLKQMPDIIYSRSNPLSSSIMAYHLATHIKDIPWVMHLSDPWFLSPLHDYKGKQATFHQTWEKKCLERANKICFTSEPTVSIYEDAYPEHRDKFEYYPNVYDPVYWKENPIRNSNKLNIIFTGGLSGKRSPEPLFRSLRLLKEKSPKILDVLNVVFAGPRDRGILNIFDKYHDLLCVKHVGNLSYPESLCLQRDAHLLLVIDNPFSDARQAVYFPSKVLDYFLAQRKILAITTPGSASDVVVRSAGGYVFAHDEIDSLTDFLSQAVKHFQNTNDQFFFQSDPPVMYDAEHVAKRLEHLILSVCTK
jgi:hypothetical protein